MSEQYPKAVVCRVLGVARSSLYHQPNSVQNEALETAMQEICAEFPCYGYRRVTAELRRRGWQINRKRTARMMKIMDLQAKKVVRKRRTTNSEHSFPRYPNLVGSLVVQRPEEVWVADTLAPHCKCRCHVCSVEAWFCLPGSSHGCVHPCHSWLALGSFVGPEPDPHRLAERLANALPGNSSLRSRSAICRH